jgi:hypothetical protein
MVEVSRRDELIALAERVEALDGRNKSGDMTILTADIARALGWVRVPPSKSVKRDGHWVAPEDCRNGLPVYCSLHGTEIHRAPPLWLWSLDAAMSLLPVIETPGDPPRHADFIIECTNAGLTIAAMVGHDGRDRCSWGATPQLALTAAALRALAEQEQ